MCTTIIWKSRYLWLPTISTLIQSHRPTTVHNHIFYDFLAPETIHGINTTYNIDRTWDHPWLFMYGQKVDYVANKLCCYPAVWNPRNNNNYFPGSVVTVEQKQFIVLGVSCCRLQVDGSTSVRWSVRLMFVDFESRSFVSSKPLYDTAKSHNTTDIAVDDMIMLMIRCFVQMHERHIKLDKLDHDTQRVVKEILQAKYEATNKKG